MRYFLVDVETTGVDPSVDAVCEIAWREIDSEFNMLDGDCTLINPMRSIPSSASAINGITATMVSNAQTLDEYLSGHQLCHSDMVFIAHSANFDFSFLKKYLHPETEKLCTLRASRILFPEAESHKQAALAYMLGLNIEREKAHSAGGDLDVLVQLLYALCEKAQCSIADLIKIANEPRKIVTMPFGKHKGVKLSELPKGYVSWLLKEATLDDDLRASLQSL